MSPQNVDTKHYGVDWACSRVGKRARFSLSIIAASVCTIVLAGCSSRSTMREAVITDTRHGISTSTITRREPKVPGQLLLRGEPEPNCAFRPIGVPDNALIAKLEYERRCYQNAELTVRHRVQALQVSLSGTIRYRSRYVEPDCEFNPIGLGDTADTVQDNSPTSKLEYERRCYQKAEATMRRRLELMEISVAKRMRHRHNQARNRNSQ